MSRPYYSLAVREHGDATWHVRSGNYERSELQASIDKLKETGWHKGKDYKIICTLDDQSDIDRALMWLNYHGPALAQMNRTMQ